MKTNMKILLLSGNPFNPNLSFYYQFKELSRSLSRKGIKSAIGFVSKVHDKEKIHFFPSHKSDKPTLLKTLPFKSLKKYTAIIALGYPGQFKKIIHLTSIPFFLWTQVSKPPGASEFEGIIPVPLTPITKVFLLTGGTSNVETVIPHGVNTRFFKPDIKKRQEMRNKLGLSGNLVIGFVGNNTLRKRYDVLLETFKYIKDEISTTRLLLKTDRKMYDGGFNIPALADKYDIKGSINIIEGLVEDNLMVGLYNAMDIYLHLSEWEGFGIPVIEAGACGITVVTHQIQGPYEIIPYPHILHIKGKYMDENGTMLRVAEPEEAAKIVLSIIKNPEKLKILSSAIRKHTINNFSMDVIAEKWLFVLKKYLS